MAQIQIFQSQTPKIRKTKLTISGLNNATLVKQICRQCKAIFEYYFIHYHYHICSDKCREERIKQRLTAPKYLAERRAYAQTPEAKRRAKIQKKKPLYLAKQRAYHLKRRQTQIQGRI